MRRKFFELHQANASTVVFEALQRIGALYAIEAEARQQLRLKRWQSLIRYANSGHLPIDNNPVENTIRPIALGKKNWLFTGSERTGKRAAAIQTLLGTSKFNGLNPVEWLTPRLA